MVYPKVEELKHLNSEIVVKEMQTSGSYPLEVLAEDDNIYYVKSCKNFDLPTYVINEFLCTGLLQVWGLPTPSIAAIKVKAEHIPFELQGRHKPHHYERVCFGSQCLMNHIEFQQLIDTPNVKASDFVNPEAIFQLGLFDIWVENDDRKPGNYNILLEPHKKALKVYAIDHAFTFCSMNYSNLPLPFVTNTFNDSILYSTVCKKLVKAPVVKSLIEFPALDKYFYTSVDKSKRRFNQICSSIPKELGFDATEQKYVYDFLFNEERNQAVLSEFKARL